jgi:hypothetical protein
MIQKRKWELCSILLWIIFHNAGYKHYVHAAKFFSSEINADRTGEWSAKGDNTSCSESCQNNSIKIINIYGKLTAFDSN